jgi:putative ABC transport system permease protein
VSVRHDPLARAVARAFGARTRAAIVLATAALGAFLVLRGALFAGLARRDADLLGGRATLTAPRPFPSLFAARARKKGLRVASWIRFPTAADHGARIALATVLAVGHGYPLRGAFRLRTGPGASAIERRRPPRPGDVWVAPALAAFLGARAGGRVNVGVARLRITGLLARAPGIGWRAALFAPPLVMSRASLAATRLVLPQSRVVYGLSLDGPRAALGAYLAWARKEALRPFVRRRRDVVRALRRTTRRLTRYAALVVLAILALVVFSLALAARAAGRRLAPVTAYLVAQGVARGRLRRRLLTSLLRPLLASVAYGAPAGLLAVVVLSSLLRGELPLVFVPVSVLASLLAAVVSVAALALFLFASVLRTLALGSPAAALRGSRLPLRGAGAIPLAVALLLVAALLVPDVGTHDPGLLAALVLGAVLLPVLFRAGFVLLARLVRRGGAGLWWPAAALARRGWAASVEASALAFAVGLALVAVGVEHAVVHDLGHGLGRERPNWFLYGVTPRERLPLARALARAGLGRVRYAPLVTARLVRIDGRVVRASSSRYRRAAWLLRHDQNLSSSPVLPPANRIVAGRFWTPATHAREASLARRFARLLHVGVGSTLTYRVAGRRVTLAVTSLRRVDWWSFRPNFFVLASPPALRGLPRSYLTSLVVPAAAVPRLAGILRRSPGVSAVDVSELLRLVRRALEASRSLAIVEASGLFLAALLLAAAALEESAQERRGERALLTLWGVGPARLRRLAVAEALILGFAAGLAAGGGAIAITRLALRSFLRLPVPPLGWMVPAALILSALFLALSVLIAPRSALGSYAALRALDEGGGSA